MNKNVYLNILKDNLHKSAMRMGIQSTFKYYQDNDPKHKARVVQEYLLYNCLQNYCSRHLNLQIWIL